LARAADVSGIAIIAIIRTLARNHGSIFMRAYIVVLLPLSAILRGVNHG
jgi:hypothetical protein